MIPLCLHSHSGYRSCLFGDFVGTFHLGYLPAGHLECIYTPASTVPAVDHFWEAGAGSVHVTSVRAFTILFIPAYLRLTTCTDSVLGPSAPMGRLR